MIDRRAMMGSGFALALGAGGLFAGRPSFAQAMSDGVLPPKSPLGVAETANSAHRRGVEGIAVGLQSNPIAYIEYCRSLGAGGVQMGVTGDLKAIRRRLDELGMYFEGQARLPETLSADLGAFEESMAQAAALGATAVRAVSRPPKGGTGRRYETFKSLADFKAWEAEANAIVEKCVPIAAKYKVAIALENHKDRTVEEHVAFLKRISSEWLGCLIDPGNNMSFMEDPVATVTALAPYVKATSLKDMGVAPYDGGFLLSEVLFDTGMTDQAALFAIMRKHNPKIFPTTELITRDPLKVPVLSDGYMAAFEPARRALVAPWLAMVKAKATVLPVVSGLSPAEAFALEAENNRKVFAWGRDKFAS